MTTEASPYLTLPIRSEEEARAGKWRTIESAPKNYTQIIVWQPKPFHTEHGGSVMATSPAGPYNAHWDLIDEAWCLSGGTWLGPFLEPSHWMPLPAPPHTEGGRDIL